MNIKSFNLLKKLIHNNNKPLQADNISSQLTVGTRTLYNYWDEICDYLIQFDLKKFFSFDGKEFRCELSEEAFRYLITSMQTMSFYEYRLSAAERQAIIAIIFLISTGPVHHSDFNEILYISQNTVSSDLKEVRNRFTRNHISFCENKYRGSIIQCQESDRRNLLLQIFDENDVISDYFINAPSNPCISYICNYIKMEKYRQLAESAINEAENKIGLHMTDYDFYKTVSILLISLIRNQSGYPITSADNIDTNKDYTQLTLFSEYVFYKLSETMVIDSFESAYFTNRIQHYKLIDNAHSDTYNEFLFTLVIKELLTEVSSFYKYNLIEDESLIEYLSAHISACYNRLKKNVIIENPYLSEITQKYQSDFQFLKENIYILENALHLSFNDGEIAYILMHILTALEKNKNNMTIPDIIVICHGGIATSNYIATQLKRHFNVNIAAIASIHNAAKVLEEHPADLIISTIPIDDFDLPVIVVNAVFSDEDMHNIRKELTFIQKNMSTPTLTQREEPVTTLSSLQSILSLDRIVLDKEVLDWKESIISAGELLLWDKLITVNYLQSMIDLVIKYGPYIVIAPHIALAHASPSEGARNTGISIVRLKTPVLFGKEKLDPIQIVVACSFLDTTENADALLRLMRSILKPDFLSTVMNAATVEEIYDYFQ
ncbi:MAG: PRD domain-containing protein [Eubacteriales bacterium]|nr:PRD domain-containing protein [Eubacteriales bacterium]